MALLVLQHVHVADAVDHQLIHAVLLSLPDTGGVDDKSFNQSAWKLSSLGVKLNLEKRFWLQLLPIWFRLATNLSSAQSQGYNLIFAGFVFHGADAAKRRRCELCNY